MRNYKRRIASPPESACVDGKCAMGNYNGMIPHPNILDAVHPLGRSWPRFINNLRLKEWQAFQLTNEEWFICLAVYNAKITGIVVIMAYNLREKKLYRYERKVPPWHLRIPCGLGDSRCCYYSRNLNIDVYNHLNGNAIAIEFSAWNCEDLPNIGGSIKATPVTEPIVSLHPFDTNRPLYSHKVLMEAEGSLHLGETVSPFTREKGLLILDDHKGFYPRTMQYDWVTAAGADEKASPIGINLTNNQIKDPEQYNENGLWKDGKMYPLPPVLFERPEGVMGPWKIRDTHEWIDIDFSPAAEVPILFNYGFIRSDYHGVFGRLSGTIHHPEGGKTHLKTLGAMGEKKKITL